MIAIGEDLVKRINDFKHKAELEMVQLLFDTVKELKKRIQSGEASPQDISNAIRICKENDVTIAINNGELLDIIENGEELPFIGDNVISMPQK